MPDFSWLTPFLYGGGLIFGVALFIVIGMFTLADDLVDVWAIRAQRTVRICLLLACVYGLGLLIQYVIEHGQK